MHILLFCAYPFPATDDEPLFCGGQYIPYYFAQSLAKKGLQVSVIARQEGKQPSQQQINGVNIYRYNSLYHLGGHRRGITFSLKRRKLTQKLLTQYNFDWVLTFSPLFWELSLLKQHNIPICYYMPGVNTGFTTNLSLSPLSILRRLAIQFMSQPLLKKNLQQAHIILANCNSDKLLIQKAYKPDIPLHVIPNGVNTQIYQQSKSKRPPSEILVVGRFSPEKGFHHVIMATQKIKPQFPHMRLRLVGFVDDQAYLDSIKHLAAKKNNSDWIIIEENVANSKMPEIFARAHVCVVFSNGYDPSPSVMLQALSCSTPVISTDWPSRREIITNGVNGFLVAENDIDALAKQITFLIAHPQVTKTMGKNARQMIKDHRDIEAITQTFLGKLPCIES